MMSCRSLLNKPDEWRTLIDQKGNAIKTTFSFFFFFIWFPADEAQFLTARWTLWYLARTIRLELDLATRNAIKSLKWIGYLRGDKKRIRYTSKPAQWAVFIWMNYFKGGIENRAVHWEWKPPQPKEKKREGFLRGKRKCGALRFVAQ